MLRSDRLPQLPVLLGVADIVTPEGTEVFEGVFEDVFEAERVVAPDLEGVFGAEPGRPVVFRFEAEEEPTDEAALDVEG